jgi:hypothetical protein
MEGIEGERRKAKGTDEGTDTAQLEWSNGQMVEWLV